MKCALVAIRAIVAATVILTSQTQLLSAQLVLRPIDSVAIEETDAVILARLAPMTVGPRGDIFETDPTESRVLQIAPNGAIVRTFGRKGEGPGELTRPSSVTFDPAVDNKGTFSGPQHLTLIDTKTKRVCADTPVPVAVNPIPQLALKADTLFTLEQGSVKGDDVVAFRRRFRIDVKQCTWKPL